MTKYLIDSSAWIEYLEGQSEAGAKTCYYIEEEETITSILSLGEVGKWIATKGKNPKQKIDYMQQVSMITQLTISVATAAGKFTIEQRKRKPTFGLADAFIYLTAQEKEATLITTDKHFEGLPGVELLN